MKHFTRIPSDLSSGWRITCENDCAETVSLDRQTQWPGEKARNFFVICLQLPTLAFILPLSPDNPFWREVFQDGSCAGAVFRHCTTQAPCDWRRSFLPVGSSTLANINPRNLVTKLNDLCRRALEGAAGLCLSRTNFAVEIEHWLLKLLEAQNSDLTCIMKQYDIDRSKVVNQLTRYVDKFRTGNGKPPSMSQDILELMEKAWVIASLNMSAFKLRSAHLLVTMLTERNFQIRLQESCPDLAKIPNEKLSMELRNVIANSDEEQMEAAAVATASPAAGGEAGQAVRPGSKTPSLDQFCTDLTEQARQKRIDPVLGRDNEIRQLIDILTRRRQNNPILAGEAGVGKTAVVEGFALRIVAGDVPETMKKVKLMSLDLGLLQAGAGAKGEFENRLKSVIAEVKASPIPIILFIDEAHTLIGAGAAPGTGDAANLLKPALARGELRTVAATTWSEYKKSFETDPALKRRFQVVKVDEPDEAKAIQMMRGVRSVLEKHHKVWISDEAVEESVKLSKRYIPDRQLPDKSVSLLDTSCARVGLSQSTTPPQLEDTRREIETLKTEIAAIEREAAVGHGYDERLKELYAALKAKEVAVAALDKRVVEERQLVTDILALRDKLEKHANAKDKQDSPDRLKEADEAKYRGELGEKSQILEKLQGERPLVVPVVNGQAVAEIVSSWTGIPLGRMVMDEIQTVMQLGKKLGERVVGQQHALDAIAQRVQTSRAGLSDPRRPIGVFLLVGPSGVGKTETAIALSEILYGGDRNMVVINMSEFKEEHKISRLTGSAAGYVGYGEGGVLTESVRRKPYSIVLLDEVEKAHQSVQEIFYQVFDKGTIQDDKGEDIDFKNTIILLTSNAGSDFLMKMCADPDTRPDPEKLKEAMHPELLKTFKPALLGRMNVVPYYPLTDEVVRRIIHLQMKRIIDRVKANHRAVLEYDDKLVNTIASRCKEVETGARAVDHIISGSVLPAISSEVLARMAEGKTLHHIKISADDTGNFVYDLN